MVETHDEIRRNALSKLCGDAREVTHCLALANCSLLTGSLGTDLNLKSLRSAIARMKEAADELA